MKPREIRDMTADEIRRKVVDLQEELFNLRFQHEIGQLENRAKLRQTRRDIARLLTVLRDVSLNPQPAKA
jgi:large subunit ribosomal protein L29